MQNSTRIPGSLRLVVGMEHAGLDGRALQIEQSAAFKRAFVTTIARTLGFEEAESEIQLDTPSAHLSRFLESFDDSGYPSDGATEEFLDSELGARTHHVGGFSVAPEAAACCYWVHSVWWSCSGHPVLQGGAPLTAATAVDLYEQVEAPIPDPVVRAQLASIAVRLKCEWPVVI